MEVEIASASLQDLDDITKLFHTHRDEPFVYLADVKLFELFGSLDFCRSFLARVGDGVAGCVYAMRHVFDCGWIGGLLVHQQSRGRGIGHKLLQEALDFLQGRHIYLFVVPENRHARKFFEHVGFKSVYRRADYIPSSTSLGEADERVEGDASHEVSWNELASTTGFAERQGVIQLGYYPVKMTSNVFEELKSEGKIHRCGDVIAATEDSYRCNLDGHDFVFSSHILGRTSLPAKQRIIEANPFYVRPNADDLLKLLRQLAELGSIVVRTYEQDPITNMLRSTGRLSLGALAMQYYKEG